MKRRYFDDGRIRLALSVAPKSDDCVADLLADALGEILDDTPTGYTLHHAGITRDGPARGFRRFHLAVYFAPIQGDREPEGPS